MRIASVLVLCSCAALAGAQDIAADPFFSLEIADVPALRTQLAASWHGRAWALPQAAPLRAALAEGLAAASSATAVPWDAIATQVTRIRVADGRTTSLALTLDAPAGPRLAAVPEAARRIAERWQAHLAACRAWEESHRGREDGVRPPESPGDIAAISLTEAGIVVGRSQSYQPSYVMEDGWRLQAQEDTLVLSHPAAGTPTMAAAAKPSTGGIAVSVDLPQWAAAAGLPGISELLRACGVGRVDGTITIADGRSREQARLPRASLPLRAVDLAALDRVVPTDALALSAIGVDGARLATLADEVARQRSDLAPLIVALRPALAALDGTAWMAVLPGAEAPGVVLGIPANAELGAWLARMVPEFAAHLADAQHAPVAVEVARRLTVVVKRSADCWLVASDEASLAATGGGFITRQRATATIPAGALALGIQDNPAILRALVRYLPALARVLRGLPDDLADCPDAIPGWMRHARARVAPLLDAAAGWAAVAEAPVSAVSLTVHDGDVILNGQDLAVGALIAPVLVPAMMALLPCVLPEWSRWRHLLHTASKLADAVPWLDLFITTHSVGASLDWLAWNRAQTNTLALSSPIPGSRALALGCLSPSDDQVQTAWAFALCRRSLDDPDPAVREGAWKGLCQNARGRGDEIDRLLLGFLGDPDPHVRLRAVESLEGTARTLRRAQPLRRPRLAARRAAALPGRNAGTPARLGTARERWRGAAQCPGGAQRLRRRAHPAAVACAPRSSRSAGAHRSIDGDRLLSRRRSRSHAAPGRGAPAARSGGRHRVDEQRGRHGTRDPGHAAGGRGRRPAECPVLRSGPTQSRTRHTPLAPRQADGDPAAPRRHQGRRPDRPAPSTASARGAPPVERPRQVAGGGSRGAAARAAGRRNQGRRARRTAVGAK